MALTCQVTCIVAGFPLTTFTTAPFRLAAILLVIVTISVGFASGQLISKLIRFPTQVSMLLALSTPPVKLLTGLGIGTLLLGQAITTACISRMTEPMNCPLRNSSTRIVMIPV